MRKFFCSALLAYCVAESQNTFELTFPSPFLNTHVQVQVYELHSGSPLVNVLFRIVSSRKSNTDSLNFFAANKQSAFNIASQIDHKICVSKFSHAVL